MKTIVVDVGDYSALAFLFLRILDAHCISTWNCRSLSLMLLLTVNSRGSAVAAVFGFILAPLAPRTAYKTPVHGEKCFKANTFSREVDGQVEAYTSLRTAGGGDCGIHAVVGSCVGTGSITAPNPRAWVADVVQDCVVPSVAVERLSARVGAVRAHQMVDVDEVHQVVQGLQVARNL